MASVDTETLDFLLQPDGQHLLAAATASYDGADSLALNETLRRLDGGYLPEQVAAALTQVGLRRAAVAKFGADAQHMYFTSAGLEQATHPAVAAHRATRTRGAGLRSCLDLGCGIGSDLRAFARSGLAVTGVESDRVTAQVAAANLEALGVPGSVLCAAAETADRTGFDVVFADPSRRRGTTRVFDPSAFSPSWDFVVGLLGAGGDGPDPPPAHVVVKLSPGLDHGLIPPHVEGEWVSFDGQLKETGLWSPAPTTTRRRATLLRSDGTHLERTDDNAPPDAPDVGGIGRYVYEPDPAIIRAHLVSIVVDEVGGWLLDPHIAYVASDREVRTGLATCFRVVEALPYKEKRLRAVLRARRVGAVTIKKRGIAVTPEELRRRLDLVGDQHVTLILTRTPGSALALLVERLV